MLQREQALVPPYEFWRVPTDAGARDEGVGGDRAFRGGSRHPLRCNLEGRLPQGPAHPWPQRAVLGRAAVDGRPRSGRVVRVAGADADAGIRGRPKREGWGVNGARDEVVMQRRLHRLADVLKPGHSVRYATQLPHAVYVAIPGVAFCSAASSLPRVLLGTRNLLHTRSIDPVRLVSHRLVDVELPQPTEHDALVAARAREVRARAVVRVRGTLGVRLGPVSAQALPVQDPEPPVHGPRAEDLLLQRPGPGPEGARLVKHLLPASIPSVSLGHAQRESARGL